MFLGTNLGNAETSGLDWCIGQVQSTSQCSLKPWLGFFFSSCPQKWPQGGEKHGRACVCGHSTCAGPASASTDKPGAVAATCTQHQRVLMMLWGSLHWPKNLGREQLFQNLFSQADVLIMFQSLRPQSEAHSCTIVFKWKAKLAWNRAETGFTQVT